MDAFQKNFKLKVVLEVSAKRAPVGKRAAGAR